MDVENGKTGKTERIISPKKKGYTCKKQTFNYHCAKITLYKKKKNEKKKKIKKNKKKEVFFGCLSLDNILFIAALYLCQNNVTSIKFGVI